MITRIYGASDDLIEIDGQIIDEVDAYSASDEPIKFKTSQGTKGTFFYDGEWKVGVKKLHRSVSNKGLFVTNYRGMLRNCDIPLLLHCL